MSNTSIQWTERIKERFWSYVKTSDQNECWPWIAGRFGNKYGQFRLGANKVKAHRCAFELTQGVIPNGMIVCHSCDNPPCCNPAHLFPGTHAVNAQDRSQKGRTATNNFKVFRGEENPAAKLCVGEVVEIRALSQSGMTLRQIANKYNISPSQVGNIARGKAWQT